MRVLINNEEVLCDKNIKIDEEMLVSSSSILNNVYPKSWEDTKDYTRFYYPEDYSKCLIYNDNDELIFCGCVKRTGNINLRPYEPHFCNLQVLDFKTLLSEGETLDFVITNKTIPQAIERVVEEIRDYGFEVGVIDILDTTSIIGAYSTNEKSAYDVFQYLSEISGSRWFTRMIDENRIAIDFYDPSRLQEGPPIEYTKEWFKDNELIDLQYSLTTEDYRNKQIILSEQVYGSVDYDEIILANGYERTFNTLVNIGVLKQITVGNKVKSFGTNEDKELGLEFDFYYTPGSNKIEQNDDESIIYSGTEVRIIYTPLVKGRQVVTNQQEVSRIENNIGRKGVLTRYETRNDTTDNEELRKIAQTYLEYKGKAEIILSVEMKNNNLWNIGDIVEFTVSPLDELKQKYMVKKKTTEIIATVDDIFYKYELTSSFNMESDINYFDNQRAKSRGNISAGEFIDRNVDIYNTVNLKFVNVSFVETEITNTNALNNALNMNLVK